VAATNENQEKYTAPNALKNHVPCRQQRITSTVAAFVSRALLVENGRWLHHNCGTQNTTPKLPQEVGACLMATLAHL